MSDGEAAGACGGAARGRLFLIPAPLGADSHPHAVLPAATLAIVARLDCFVVENARSARAFLKAAGTDLALQSLELRELDEHTPAAQLPALLAPLLAGRDVGLLSEAGCPAVADPGADLVAAAHAAGVQVVPLVGPSSLLLALMASGLQGQRFGFVGYLPVQPAARAERLRELERRSAAGDETLLWIETPYRNQQVFDAALAALAPATRLLVASQLSLPDERIRVQAVHAWRRDRAELARVPTVFGLLAEARAGRQPAAAAAAAAGRNSRARRRAGVRPGRAPAQRR